jgi:hypothetical protein
MGFPGCRTAARLACRFLEEFRAGNFDFVAAHWELI